MVGRNLMIIHYTFSLTRPSFALLGKQLITRSSKKRHQFHCGWKSRVLFCISHWKLFIFQQIYYLLHSSLLSLLLAFSLQETSIYPIFLSLYHYHLYFIRIIPCQLNNFFISSFRWPSRILLKLCTSVPVNEIRKSSKFQLQTLISSRNIANQS